MPLLLTLLAAYALLALALLLFQGRLIFPRHATGPVLLERPPEGCVEAIIETDDGDLVCWYFPADGASASNPVPCVLFAHGNAELMSHNLDLVHRYRAAGFGVLLMEYRGYGDAPGTPTQRGLTADAVALVRWLEARPEVDAERLVYHGRSIGGGVMCQAALVRQPAALVLESTFTSVASFAPRFLMPPAIVRHPFRNDRALRDLPIPILLVHGRADEIVPVRHAQTLHELARDSSLVELEGGHNSVDPVRVFEHTLAFLRARGVGTDTR